MLWFRSHRRLYLIGHSTEVRNTDENAALSYKFLIIGYLSVVIRISLVALGLCFVRGLWGYSCRGGSELQKGWNPEPDGQLLKKNHVEVRD